jgi:hypothetical protein
MKQDQAAGSRLIHSNLPGWISRIRKLPSFYLSFEKSKRFLYWESLADIKNAKQYRDLFYFSLAIYFLIAARTPSR